MQVIAWTMDADYDEATRVVDPLVRGMPIGPGPWHSGGRLVFGPQGHLWIATGDGRVVTGAQDLTSLGGKVLRVDPRTGAGALGNPFGASSPVYSYGFRNPQGLALRPDTDQMWLVEHGPKHDDEINLLVAGGNYGWDPIPGDGASVFYDYADEAGVPMTDLAKFPSARHARWSSGFPTLATSGAVFLDGPQWGEWEGRLAVATLKTKSLRVFEFTEAGEFAGQIVVPELDGSQGRLRTPVLGPDGGSVHRHLQQARQRPDSEGERQPCRDGSALHQRHPPCGRGTGGRHDEHRRRGRAGKRRLQIPMDTPGRRDRDEHRDRYILLHPRRRGFGPADQGAGYVHRRRGERGICDQRRDGDGGAHGAGRSEEL